MLGNNIETFLAIVSTGSLSKAAEMLNITQSAVSLRLKRLENDLGSTLFDRARGGKIVTLTTSGENFLPTAEKILSMLQHFSQKSSFAGLLRIGAVDSAHAYLLHNLYQALMKQAPPVQLILETHQSWQLSERLERRELDVGFALSARYNPNLKVEPIFKEHFYVMRLFRNDKRSIIEHRELDPNEELRIQWGEEYMMWHDKLWNPHIASAVKLDTMALISALMIRPEQWAIVPESVRKKNSEAYIFQELDFPPPPRICYKITHWHPRLGAIEGLRILDDLLDSLCL